MWMKRMVHISWTACKLRLSGSRSRSNSHRAKISKIWCYCSYSIHAVSNTRTQHEPNWRSDCEWQQYKRATNETSRNINGIWRIINRICKEKCFREVLINLWLVMLIWIEGKAINEKKNPTDPMKRTQSYSVTIEILFANGVGCGCI